MRLIIAFVLPVMFLGNVFQTAQAQEGFIPGVQYRLQSMQDSSGPFLGKQIKGPCGSYFIPGMIDPEKGVLIELFVEYRREPVHMVAQLVVFRKFITVIEDELMVIPTISISAIPGKEGLIIRMTPKELKEASCLR